jgi:hypothetical protein
VLPRYFRVIASAAKQSILSLCCDMDCFAALAMTRIARSALDALQRDARQELCNFATPKPAEPASREGVIWVSSIMFAVI